MSLRTIAKIVLVACSLAPAAFAQQTPPQPQPQPPITTPVTTPVPTPAIVEGPAAPAPPAPGTWTRPDKSRKPKMRVCHTSVYTA